MSPQELLGAEAMALADRLLPALSVKAGRHPGERSGKRATGQGEDFYEFRPYQPGQDVRHLDWPRFLTRGEKLLRSYLERTLVKVVLALDSSGSMAVGRVPAMDLARRWAALLGYVALRLSSRVTLLWTTGDRGSPASVERIDLSGGGAQLWRICDVLSRVEASGRTDLPALAEAAMSAAAGCSTLVFISDFLVPDPPATVLDRLVGPGVDPACMLVAGEADPGGAEGVFRLEDPEGGRSRRVGWGPEAKRRYRSALEDRRRQVVAACARRQIPCFMETGMEELVGRAARVLPQIPW